VWKTQVGAALKKVGCRVQIQAKVLIPIEKFLPQRTGAFLPAKVGCRVQKVGCRVQKSGVPSTKKWGAEYAYRTSNTSSYKMRKNLRKFFTLWKMCKTCETKLPGSPRKKECPAGKPTSELVFSRRALAPLPHPSRAKNKNFAVDGGVGSAFMPTCRIVLNRTRRPQGEPDTTFHAQFPMEHEQIA
jgi:hypothetical protein